MVVKSVFAKLGQLFLLLLVYVLALVIAGKIFEFLLGDKSSLHLYAAAGILDAFVIIVAYASIKKYVLSEEIIELKFSASRCLKYATIPVLLLGVSTVFLLVTGFYTIESTRSWQLVPFAFIALFMQGISSEVLFRGIIFNYFLRWFGSNFAILLFCSLYTTLNMFLDGFNLQVFATHWLFCCFLCLLFVRTNNIWLTGVFHGMWLFASFLPGVIDEHWREGAPWITNVVDNSVISGGSLGAEASLISLIGLIALNIYYYVKYIKNSK